MKKIYLALIMAFAFGTGLSAQTFQVTLEVDMSNVGMIADSVTVAGNFQVAAGYASDWTPGITVLTDANNDDIYDITLTLPAGSYEYKFLNGTAWGTDEGVPGACATNGNRGMTVTMNQSEPQVCFGMCTTCPTTVDTVSVTLMVDMANETVGDTVSVAGDLQGPAGFTNWTPGATVLTDANMDGVYEVTLDLPEGTYQYKYINGTAWGQDESVPSACAVSNNRELVVMGPGPMVVPVHCFAACDTCVPPLPAINVTFQVDMTNEIVNSSGLYVAGSFQNPAWVKDTLEMTDANGDGIYQFSTSIVPGEYQFKFYNGDGGDPDGESADFVTLGCGVDNGVGGFNRLLDITGLLQDTILCAYEYNTCICTPTSIDAAFEGAVKVYPNPFSQSTTLEFVNRNFDSVDLRIVNITGQTVRMINDVRSDRIEIPRGDLTTGLYFIDMVNEKGQRLTHKIVVE